MYARTAQGTEHRTVKQAIAQASEARAKASKTGRLLAEAAQAFARYLDVVAPGSLPVAAGQDSFPSGPQLAEEGIGRGSVSSKLLGRTTTIKNADDGIQHGKKIANIFQQAFNPGGVAAERPVPNQIEMADDRPGAGDALLGAAVVAIVGIKGAEIAARLRHKARGNNDEEEGIGGE